MASKQKIPLITDQQITNNHIDQQNGHKDGENEEGSEVMQTFETSSYKPRKQPTYDSLSDKDNSVLLPGDVPMTRDEGMCYHLEIVDISPS